MYNYPYYNQQPSLDRINNQIAELEKAFITPVQKRKKTKD